MDARALLRLGATGRVVLGAALLAAPALSGRGWGGDAADSPGGRTFLRGFGARDIGIGAGTLAALASGRPVRAWALAAVAADAADAVATLGERDRLGPMAVPGVLALAATSALAHAYAAARLD